VARYDKVIYEKNDKEVNIICLKHGDFLQKLKQEFPNESIIWEASPKWLKKQRFDMYFPKYKIAVEYNGKQHYVPVSKFGGKIEFEKILQRDVIKRTKCKDNNCNLFEIKYNYNEDVYDKMINKIKNLIIKSNDEN